VNSRKDKGVQRLERANKRNQTGKQSHWGESGQRFFFGSAVKKRTKSDKKQSKRDKNAQDFTVPVIFLTVPVISIDRHGYCAVVLHHKLACYDSLNVLEQSLNNDRVAETIAPAFFGSVRTHRQKHSQARR
jgi:hypothetical protein